MPATVPGIMGVLIPNLVSTGMIGQGVPTYCQGVAIGLSIWAPQVKITSVDAGTAGSGKCVPIPVLAPPPLVYGNVIAGMTSNGLLGILMPAFALGLANGLSASFAQMLISTTNPTVGSGAGVAKFVAPPCTPSMLQGFASAGMKGDATVRKARAVGMAVDLTFASLVMPIVIVGPSAPFAGGGAGFGTLV